MIGWQEAQIHLKLIDTVQLRHHSSPSADWITLEMYLFNRY